MRRGWFKVGIPMLLAVVLVAGSVFAGANASKTYRDITEKQLKELHREYKKIKKEEGYDAAYQFLRASMESMGFVLLNHSKQTFRFIKTNEGLKLVNNSRVTPLSGDYGDLTLTLDVYSWSGAPHGKTVVVTWDWSSYETWGYRCSNDVVRISWDCKMAYDHDYYTSPVTRAGTTATSVAYYTPDTNDDFIHVFLKPSSSSYIGQLASVAFTFTHTYGLGSGSISVGVYGGCPFGGVSVSSSCGSWDKSPSDSPLSFVI